MGGIAHTHQKGTRGSTADQGRCLQEDSQSLESADAFGADPLLDHNAADDLYCWSVHFSWLPWLQWQNRISSSHLGSTVGTHAAVKYNMTANVSKPSSGLLPYSTITGLDWWTLKSFFFMLSNESSPVGLHLET